MRQSDIHTDFNLSIKEYFAKDNPVHRHNFFELIYVLEGRGIHLINDNQFAYGKGDLFLLMPTDAHTFKSHIQSKFCIIDFTASFFGRHASAGYDKPELSHFFKQLEYLFQNAARLKGFISMNEEDRLFSGILMERLIAEWERPVFFREIVLQNLVFLLLNIIARYAALPVPAIPKAIVANTAYEMINYIQHHIYDSDHITIENIADHFHFSKDYAGAYFKKHTGKNIKQFILDYKMELIKTRLQYSKLTISQIAAELGFTDESHLGKIFRQKFNMTVKQYRDQILRK